MVRWRQCGSDGTQSRVTLNTELNRYCSSLEHQGSLGAHTCIIILTYNPYLLGIALEGEVINEIALDMSMSV